MNEIKDMIEILELCKDEINNNDENVSAVLDLQDLKSLQKLLDLYKKQNKMINMMAECLVTSYHDKDWVIKYFEDEVKLENEQ